MTAEHGIEYRLPLSQLIADHGMNISRAGKRHDKEYVKQLAERFVVTGQTTPIEVFRFDDDPQDGDDPWRIAAGFGRFDGASYVEHLMKNEANFDPGLYKGYLRAVEVPRELLAGKSKEEIVKIIQDRNVDENVHRNDISLIDEALAVIFFTTPADKGGRGEDIRYVAQRMHKSGEQIHKLKKLGGLCEEARVLVRQHHRDKEVGINEVQAYKLASRTEEEQIKIIKDAKDATGRVTPKGVQAVINPHSGRQGQPEAVTGASLTIVTTRLERILKDKGQMTKNKVTEDEVNLTINLLAALRDRTDEAFAKLPGKLGAIVKNELSKS